VAGVKLRCEAIERDRHGRLVAKVFSPNRVDIGRRLVSAGWALTYRRYSMDYVAAEDEGALGQARHVAGQLRETLGMACIGAAAGHTGRIGECC
jgi:endonuclease YncB( thermonuclease family)